MISMRIILTIARFEALILFRSWFFRIFSLIALILLGLINYVIFVRLEAPWMYKGLPACIPYLNLLLLNVVQAVIAVFMASDFLKYDRKLDTTDVVYMRSITNADYVLGKILGLLGVFAGLNLMVLIMALVFNVFFADLPVVPAAYLLYPLLISLPTLVFIFGLTFLLMVIVRNQALTFIILLGYIASTIFYLSGKFNNLFDYMAFQVPLMYSDFVGFGDLTPVLIHRGIYFLAGVGFIFFTVCLLRRLPQSRVMNRVSLTLAVLSIAGAGVLVNSYIARLSGARALRGEMVALSKEAAGAPVVSLERCSLDLIHTDREIAVEAGLKFSNKTREAIDRYVFSLNPGLEVVRVIRDGGDIQFTRNLHILTVEPQQGALEPGAADSLVISYRGGIDERACYLDISEEAQAESYRFGLYKVDKRACFIRPDYVLLTPENLWYPKPGVPEGAVY
ncbi:MAG: xanthan lyase, partial [Gemmatimonadota bacterium]|nr:xanthan lyase [Gemmatimonadota bacterium]